MQMVGERPLLFKMVLQEEFKAGDPERCPVSIDMEGSECPPMDRPNVLILVCHA